MGNASHPGSSEVIMDWPEGEDVGILPEQVTCAEETDPNLKFVLSVMFRGLCACQEKTKLLLLIKSVFFIEKIIF